MPANKYKTTLLLWVKLGRVTILAGVVVIISMAIFAKLYIGSSGEERSTPSPGAAITAPTPDTPKPEVSVSPGVTPPSNPALVGREKGQSPESSPGIGGALPGVETAPRLILSGETYTARLKGFHFQPGERVEIWVENIECKSADVSNAGEFSEDVTACVHAVGKAKPKVSVRRGATVVTFVDNVDLSDLLARLRARLQDAPLVGGVVGSLIG